MPKLEELLKPATKQALATAAVVDTDAPAKDVCTCASRPDGFTCREDGIWVHAGCNMPTPAYHQNLMARAIEIDVRSEAIIVTVCACGEEIALDPTRQVPTDMAGKPRVPMCAECATEFLAGKTGRVIHKPQVAKHPWRVTDGQEYPVVVTNTSKEHNMPVNLSDLSDAELGAKVRKAALDEAAAALPEKRKKAKKAKAKTEAKHKAAAKQERAERKATKPLPEFVYGTGEKAVTVPALDLSEVTSLDEAVPAKLRSPYNKVRFRLLGEPALPSPQACEEDASLALTTWKVLAKEHMRLLEANAAKQAEVAKPKKAAKTKKIAAVVDTDEDAKVKAVMAQFGVSEKKARKLLA